MISVILPVYNGAAYLKEAIESILNQTYTNFELIIINDGSIDTSEKIIKFFCDSRIIYLYQENQGLAATLNNGIKIAKGKYIARQDQDDISLPDRFKRQIAYLEAHSQCGMVGCWAKILTGNSSKERFHKHPSEYAEILFELLFDNPIVHSSVMIRRSVFETVGLYTTDKMRQPPEDYELWSRIAKYYPIANIPEVLQHYRQVSTGMSFDKLNPFAAKVRLISRENIAYYSKLKFNSDLVTDLVALYHGGEDNRKIISDYHSLRELILNLTAKFIQIQPELKDKLNRKVQTLLKRIRSNYLRYHYGRYIGRSLFFCELFFQILDIELANLCKNL
jgi:glycosyltransferase involved in cell wall biosynthesis